MSQRTRLQNVPLVTTLNYMMWELSIENRINAENAYRAKFARIEVQSVNIDDTTTRRAEMKSVEDRDESHRFKQFRDYYINQNDKVHDKVRQEYKALVKVMTRRILKFVDVLVISANNASNEFA